MIYCFHSINPNNIPNINPTDELTFDDGNFSQFYYHNLFNNYKNKTIFPIGNFAKNKKIRNISTEIIQFPHTAIMMHQWRNNNFINALHIDELKFLLDKGYDLGCHSFYHDIIYSINNHKKQQNFWKKELIDSLAPIYKKINVNIYSKLSIKGLNRINNKLSIRTHTQWINYIKEDTEKALEWFYNNFKLTPTKYCFPFNDESDTLKNILINYGFKKFYGKNRTEI